MVDNTIEATNATAAKATTRRKLSNQGGPSDRRRSKVAAITASVTFAVYHTGIVQLTVSTWSSKITCAGKAAASSHHHDRLGVSSSAASSTAFGAQSAAKK